MSSITVTLQTPKVPGKKKECIHSNTFTSTLQHEAQSQRKCILNEGVESSSTATVPGDAGLEDLARWELARHKNPFSRRRDQQSVCESIK